MFGGKGMRRIGKAAVTSSMFGFGVHVAIPHEVSGALVAEPIPSETEVENALTSLQQVFRSASRVPLVTNVQDTALDNTEGHVTDDYTELDNEGQVKNNHLVDQVSSEGSETDWAEPSYPYNSRMLQVNGSDRVLYAIHLLETDAYIQRMVKSLSSDKAIWDAMLNNEAVRELRESIFAEKEHIIRQRPNGTGNNDSVNIKHVIRSIFDSTKTKLLEATAKIIKILCKLFGHDCQKSAVEGSDLFNEKLRACFMLSIMVFLIVVVQRLNSQGTR